MKHRYYIVYDVIFSCDPVTWSIYDIYTSYYYARGFKTFNAAKKFARENGIELAG